MASSEGGYSSDIPDEHLDHRFLSWSEHVLSWIEQEGFPVHVVRYEDMQGSPLETFTAAARFCGLACDPDSVRRALDHSSFEKLQKQERKSGFRERPKQARPRASFFAKARLADGGRFCRRHRWIELLKRMLR